VSVDGSFSFIICGGFGRGGGEVRGGEGQGRRAWCARDWDRVADLWPVLVQRSYGSGDLH